VACTDRSRLIAAASGIGTSPILAALRSKFVTRAEADEIGAGCDFAVWTLRGYSGTAIRAIVSATLERCKLALPGLDSIRGTTDFLIAQAQVFKGHNQVERCKSDLVSRITYCRPG
jgi:hypothetical protein